MGTQKIEISSRVRALIEFAVIAFIVYITVRVVFLAYAKYTGIEKLLAVLFFLSEAFVMFHGVAYANSIFRLDGKVAVDEAARKLESFPSVAVLVPVRHEPKEVLESTLISCYNLDYLNKHLFLLDDSSEERYQKEAEVLARQYGFKIFQREKRHGAKAGIINDCVKTLTEKYFAIFDVDQNPMPNFLLRLIAILEANSQLALVQTPQFYSNLDASRISFVAQMQQSVFYEYVCEGKSTNQSMICCGTNVVIRREALLDAGGMDESSVTEDFATTFKLHSRGWKTLYYNRISTFGMGPLNLGAYFKQQFRWAMGNVGVLREIVKGFLRTPRHLKWNQWLEYFITGSYYLSGFAYLFLVFCPITYIFFNIPSFFMNPLIYALTFFPYLILTRAIFHSTMQMRRYTLGQMLQGEALLFLTLPVFAKASFFGLLGLNGTFHVTSKESLFRISYVRLWPQLVFWGISLASIVWGLNRFIYEPTAAIMINVIWITYHFALFSSLFYFNETD